MSLESEYLFAIVILIFMKFSLETNITTYLQKFKNSGLDKPEPDPNPMDRVWISNFKTRLDLDRVWIWITTSGLDLDISDIQPDPTRCHPGT